MDQKNQRPVRKAPAAQQKKPEQGRRNSAPLSRKFKYGAMATVFSVVFVAAVIVLNVIVSAVDGKYPLSVDMTESKFFTVSESSVEMVRARLDEWKNEVGEDIRITVTFLYPRDVLLAAGDAYKWVVELAESYAHEFDQISLEFREDLYSHPENYVEYTRFGEKLDRNSIIFSTDSSKASYKIITFDSCLVYDEDGQSVWAFKGEMQFNSVLMQITDRVAPVVSFTKGHGETIPQNLLDFFTSCGFRIQYVDLSQEEISEDTKILFVSNPTKDFVSSGDDARKSEYTRLSDYLNAYRSAIVTLAPPETGTYEELPNLEAILERWGLRVNRNAVIMDDSYSDPQNKQALYVRYAESENIAAALTGSLTEYTHPPRTLSTHTAPIEVLEWGDGDTENAEPVLITSADAYIEEVGENGEITRVNGEYTAMAISSRFTYINNAKVYGHLLLIGTDRFSETNAFQSQFGNTEILYNAVRLMTNESVAVDQNYEILHDYALTMENRGMYVFAAITVAVIPIGVFALGIVVYVRRKYM